MSISVIFSRMIRAIAFLSRVPVPARWLAGETGKFGELAAYFPFAGLIIALPAAAMLALFDWLGTSPALTALLALGLMTLTTGALHEDGLADCADGFGAGGEKERILAIFKDSRIGAFGTLALIFSVAIRAICLTTIIAIAPPLMAAACFLGIAALGRGLMVWHWQALSAARESGLSAGAGAPSRLAAYAAPLAGIILAVSGSFLITGDIAALVAALIALLFVQLWTRFVRRRIGGQTGDTIGAAEQIAEISFLIALDMTF